MTPTLDAIDDEVLELIDARRNDGQGRSAAARVRDHDRRLHLLLSAAMPQKSFRDALNEAHAPGDGARRFGHRARRRRLGRRRGTSGNREASGGIFGVTKGLLPRFGENRVIDTPISESAIIGAAGGAALAGMRPIAELMFADFVGVSMDQIFNQMAKFRYMFGGKTRCPAVVRLAMGAGMNMGAQHSQSMYSLLTAVPGLEGRRAVERLRCEGSADPGDSRRRSRDVLRAQGALPAQRRGARTARTRSRSARRTCCAKASTSRSLPSVAWSSLPRK